MLDAAQLAAILDPERKMPGWWGCSGCNNEHSEFCSKCMDGRLTHRDFIGPPDLHTAREHCWRMEDWLEARGYGWRRNWLGYTSTVVIDRNGFGVVEHQDHTAALNTAIERITNG